MKHDWTLMFSTSIQLTFLFFSSESFLSTYMKIFLETYGTYVILFPTYTSLFIELLTHAVFFSYLTLKIIWVEGLKTFKLHDLLAPNCDTT